ncbi:hypothetical protein NFC81_12265 [Salinispirillum sp. LH 10-3-1]|uniref:DUF1800 domain-containing protein n=1 Tax=Salinispirillum sp. LH 10-3-1 TaxID=2952525 RepID=A0AB38YEK7_9GAMM
MNHSTTPSFGAIATGLLMAVVLAGCNPGTPDQNQQRQINVTGAAAPLSSSDYRALTPEQQYDVANKLLSSFYRGVPVDEFFDLSYGMSELRLRQPDFLATTRQALNRPLLPEVRASIRAEIGLLPDNTPVNQSNVLYEFTTNTNDNSTVLHRQVPLAQIIEYPISRDLYVEWMAYFLTNTIMFSPALEMESTDAKDAAFVYGFLRNSIRNGTSIQDTVRQYLGTQSRWRVSRSAENHALEAYELFLGLFETEEDSRRGGIACSEWRLTPESAQYQLVRSGEPNTQYQKVLDNYYILDCDDLHSLIVSHPLFIPRVTEVIVNYFLAEESAQVRSAFVASIAAAQPQTFEDIFSAILFSRHYLLHSERPLWFEENFFGTLHRLRWTVARNQGWIGRPVLRHLQEHQWSALFQRNMGSAAMEYKIGRTPSVPMDAMSFASQAKAMREQVFVNNRNGWQGGTYSSNTTGFRGLLLEAVPRTDDPTLWQTQRRPDVEALTAAEYLDYLFLTTLRRRATDAERHGLLSVMRTDDGTPGMDLIREIDGAVSVRPNNNYYYTEVAQIVFEYVARLPEFYYQRRTFAVAGTGGAQ